MKEEHVYLGEWGLVLVGLLQPLVPLFVQILTSAICDFLRREDEVMTELMNHKRSTSY
jgi:uncharacterized membrane protein YbaN (DUF454 family)